MPQSHMMQQLDLPLITEATSDYYRSIYADPDLGPIFKGINMVVLRQHVAYFLSQLVMFDTPLTDRQLEYLRRVHQPVILQHNITQKHYDLMFGYMIDAMRANGAEEDHLTGVQAKLQPLRDVFPAAGSEDGHVRIDQAPAAAAHAKVPTSCSSTATVTSTGQQARSRGASQQVVPAGCPMAGRPTEVQEKKKHKSWLKRLMKGLGASSSGKNKH